MLAIGPGVAFAYDGFTSEISHAFAGAGTAMVVSVIAERQGAESPRWIGFGSSVALSLVAEGAQVAGGGAGVGRSSALDFASNLVGAAVGTWLSDRYLLTPVVARDAQGRRVVGAALRLSF